MLKEDLVNLPMIETTEPFVQHAAGIKPTYWRPVRKERARKKLSKLSC